MRLKISLSVQFLNIIITGDQELGYLFKGNLGALLQAWHLAPPYIWVSRLALQFWGDSRWGSWEMWENWSELQLCSSCHFNLAWHGVILPGSGALGPLLWLPLPCRHQAKSFMEGVAHHFHSLSSSPRSAYSVSAGLQLLYHNCSLSVPPCLFLIQFPTEATKLDPL